MQGRIFLQCQARAYLIVIRRIGGKNSAKMYFTENYHLIQALAAQCADQTFSTAILPWRPGTIGRSRIPISLTRDVKACP
jgi:hypothetical protein